MTRIERMPPELLQWVQDRCAMVDGCWVWKQSLAHGTEPQGRYQGKIILVRRVVYNATRTKPLGRNWLSGCSCVTEGCVHPDHLTGTTRSAHQRGIKKGHGARVAIGQRAKSKLNAEAIEDIRSLRESSAEAAVRYGVTKDHINQIRAHKVWRDYSNPFAGLFTGLVASNDTNRRAA